MWTYVLRRLLQALPVIVGVALLSFALTEASGDAVRALLGAKATPDVIAKARAFHDFDQPRAKRFASYLLRLFSGNLGVSIVNHGQPVVEMLTTGLKVTFRLALGAILIATVLGLTLGILAAWRPHSFWDYGASFFAAIGISFPAFFLGMLFLLLFAVKLQWFPIGGYKAGQLSYLVLPCVTLGLLSTASIARLTRNCMLEALAQDYVRTARAKGLGERPALLHHALPNALVPIVTIVGNDFAGLLTGAVLTETVYGLPGIGSVLSSAIFGRDLPVVVGCCVVLALIFVMVNLLVDLSYALLDPRIRYGS